jgi:7-cyano-7-deazaguanine synthase
MTDLVLLSGGMDSTAALAVCADAGILGAAVSIDYGQRHKTEVLHAIQIAGHFGVPHMILDLSKWGSLLKGSALTDPTVDLPYGHYAAESMKATIVPNRNATFLSAACGVAIGQGYDRVVTAVHAGDHAIYPDCRPEFIDALNEAISLGTDGAVEIWAPFVNRTKTDIARIGSSIGAPFEMSWSCYEGGPLHCGRCGTCTERIEAFREAGVVDPTIYATEQVSA